MNFSDLDRYLDHQVTDCKIPYLDLAVSLDGKQIYRHGTGHPDAEGKNPVRGDELTWIFSASKVITCFAAVRLIGEGKLSLDDPVSKYLPAFAHLTVRNPDGTTRPAENTMTVEHLFCMTGGMDYDLKAPAILAGVEQGMGTVALVSEMAKKPLLFEPGTDYRYSLCHDVLAAVVEVITGMKFSEYLKTVFFDPLGLKDIGFRPTAEQQARFASLFEYRAGTQTGNPIPLKNQFALSPDYDSGGAGLFSSVDDYMAIISAVACGGVAPNGYRLLKEEWIPMMQENRLPPRALDHFINYRHYGYGWGLCGRVHMNPAMSWSLSPKGEFGWDGAASAFSMVDPKNRIALYLGTQIFGGPYLYQTIHPDVRNMVYRILG